MAFTPNPSPPNSGNPATFNGDADAFFGWMAIFVQELNSFKVLQSSLEHYGEYYPVGSVVNIDAVAAGAAGLYNSSNPGTFPEPATGIFWWIKTQRIYSNSAAMQVAVRYFTAAPAVGQQKYYFRTRSGDGTYGPWVSLSGEYGSNANGEYQRLPNGMQICTRTATISATTSAVGNLHRATLAAWTYPAAFIAAPAVQLSPSGLNVWGGVGSVGSSMAVERLVWSAMALSGAGIAVSDFAIGRWF